MDSIKSLFTESLNKNVKACYEDGVQFKIARGVLESIDNGFLKIKGKLGTIIINERNIQKLAEVSK